MEFVALEHPDIQVINFHPGLVSVVAEQMDDGC